MGKPLPQDLLREELIHGEASVYDKSMDSKQLLTVLTSIPFLITPSHMDLCMCIVVGNDFYYC